MLFLHETRISLPGYSTLNVGNPKTCTVFSDDHFSAVCAAAARPVIHIGIETLSLPSRGGSLDVSLSSERREHYWIHGLTALSPNRLNIDYDLKCFLLSTTIYWIFRLSC